MQDSRHRSADPVARLAERQNWIAPDAEVAVQDAVRESFNVFGKNADAVRSVLHGDWLHEPLHAVMTDVPVGSWTATVLFDGIGAVFGSHTMDAAADATNLLGLAGAAGAAVLGLNDWAEIKEEAPRRIGAVHGLLNVGATVLFAWSALARRRSSTRARARALAAVGYVLVSVSAHLGGNLIYEHGIGVEASKPWQDATPPSGS